MNLCIGNQMVTSEIRKLLQARFVKIRTISQAFLREKIFRKILTKRKSNYFLISPVYHITGNKLRLQSCRQIWRETLSWREMFPWHVFQRNFC